QGCDILRISLGDRSCDPHLTTHRGKSFYGTLASFKGFPVLAEHVVMCGQTIHADLNDDVRTPPDKLRQFLIIAYTVAIGDHCHQTKRPARMGKNFTKPRMDRALTAREL